METVEAIYTTEALATGEGRNGNVRTSDGSFEANLATPKEMGGTGNGNNPEQLFAAGYAACFHSALQMVARSQKKNIAGSAVGARVSIGKQGEGFGLAVVLEVVIPDMDRVEAQALADAAHQVCPYSNATRGNIPVDVIVTED